MAGLRVVEVPTSGRTSTHPGSNRTDRAPARGLLGALTDLCDRALHDRRARNARARLQAWRNPSRILVVCHGNVFRSPYMQQQLQRRLPHVQVVSAGFAGSDRSVPASAANIAARRGVDLSGYRSQPITQSKIDAADFVLVMDSRQSRELYRNFLIGRRRIFVVGDFDGVSRKAREIPDPADGDVATFEATFDRLDRCVEGILRIVGGSASSR